MMDPEPMQGDEGDWLERIEKQLIDLDRMVR
jgi:hypothetical protein